MEPARLGVGVTEMTPELRKFFGAPANHGILVARIEEDSAAERARIRVGDVIIKVGDQDVEDAGDIRRALTDDEVVVVLVRKKKRVKKRVRLETKPEREGPPGELVEELRRTRDQIEKIERRLEKLERARPKSKSKSKSKSRPRSRSRSRSPSTN